LHSNLPCKPEYASAGNEKRFAALLMMLVHQITHHKLNMLEHCSGKAAAPVTFIYARGAY
jgi:hypothetical protein